MTSSHDREKERAMDLAEDSRETEWAYPSFIEELFRGNFRWELLHPFPEQSPEDKRAGDEYISKIRRVLEAYIDPCEVDRSGEIPEEAKPRRIEIARPAGEAVAIEGKAETVN